MDQSFGLGGIPSGIDYRDDVAAAAVAGAFLSLPASFDTDLTVLGPVLHQHKTPACVSHAWALILKLYWYRKTGKVIEFSPRFLHIMSNDGNFGPEDGRYPRTVAKISSKIGCCTTATLPNDTSLDNATYMDKSVITQAMLDEAAQYKIPGYVRIADHSPLDFRQAVILFEAISGLFQIGSEWWTPSWSPSDIDPLRIPSEIVSGHQIVVKGYNGQFNAIRNSWGDLWADKGENRYDPVAWMPYIVEGWAPAEIPADAQQLMSDLPDPASFHYQWNMDLTTGIFNDDVKFAQVALMILGFLKPILPGDLGHYGPKTSAAVQKYQASKGIFPTVPNTIGPRTRAALNAQFAL